MTPDSLCGINKSVNGDTATASQTTSVTAPTIKSHFIGKWKLPCGHFHTAELAQGEIIKLTHIRNTAAVNEHRKDIRQSE